LNTINNCLLNTTPFVSVIIAVYNGEKYIEETIISILNQSFKGFELIIIDGGSSDRTLDIINKYKEQIHTFISEPDKGIYDAWNKAVKLSKGEWITFIGSDDIFHEDALLNYINYIQEEKTKKLDYVSSVVELVDSDLKPIRLIGQEWNWPTFKKFMNVAHVGSFHNRRLFEKYGLFNSDYRIAGDYEFLLRPKQNLNVGYINNITAKMRFGGASLSNSSIFKETFRAKVLTAQRSCVLSYFEMLLARLKFLIRIKLNHFS
jgi:glycosyltransferase involved in cell wall biosynthesis